MNHSSNDTKKNDANQKGYTLPSHEDKPAYVQENFNQIAERYDLFNDAITFGMHRVWKKKTIQAAGVKDSGVLLDLCCGTGDMALMAARMSQKENIRIIALDFSPGMLEILKSRLEKSPDGIKKTIEMVQGDAMNLKEISDSSIDGITIGFGLRNVANRDIALKEMLRVLKAGGHLAILEVSKVQIAPIRFFHRIFFEKIVPIIGFIIHGKKHEMYEYLPASAKAYPDQESLKKEIENAGFHSVSYKNFLFGSAALHTAIRP